jgi:hypothetical protein
MVRDMQGDSVGESIETADVRDGRLREQHQRARGLAQKWITHVPPHAQQIMSNG